MSDPLTSVLKEIQQLLAAPRAGADAPPLARLEDTLTTGYAEALALEAERFRLERRLGQMTATLREDGSRRRTDEIATLAARLTETDGQLSSLRRVLEPLRMRASDLRLAESRSAF